MSAGCSTNTPARYDTALTERLHYRGPALLREAVEARAAQGGRPLRFGSMLDLGCGTGLGGAVFRPFVDWLVGVDLSPAMIAQASTKGFYDRLVTAELADFLADEASDMANYHLVLAADVFVYVNDLAPIIAGIARVLAPGRPARLHGRDPCRRRRKAAADAALCPR